MDSNDLRKFAGLLTLKESVESETKEISLNVIRLAKRHRDATDAKELAFLLQDLVQQKEIKPQELKVFSKLLDFIADMSESGVTGTARKN